MQGSIYGTGLLQNTTHLDICVDILAEDYVKAIYRMQSPPNEDSHTFTSIYSVLKMIWSVHPLLINCFNAPDDIFEQLIRKFDEWDDARVIATNLIHNIGYVHDAYSEIKIFF